MCDDGFRGTTRSDWQKIAHKLRLTANDLAPCLFTIVTSIGYVEQTTSYTGAITT